MLLRSNFPILYTLVFVIIFLTSQHHGAHSISGPHLADVNILLPPKMTHPVEYRLLGSDGCFKWSWDHHDILSVIPEYNESNHCSNSARLKSIAPYSGRKETAVYAADVHSGIVVRCKVYIDVFTRIQIFHHSVKLDLDGLATLRVRAFDSEENVFSSLVGLRFMWQLMPESDGSPPHLVHVPLSDSPLSDCSGFCGDLEIQTKLEDSGVFSDLLVVKGTEIGHEVVAVRLLEPHFGNMVDKIVLTVAEAMSLDPPSPVLVLVGAAVQYTLKIIRGNYPQVVPLPSPFHRWSASNSSIAQVDAVMGTVHAVSLGETSIVVEDTRVAGHVQISSLNVVLPDHMCLYLLPLTESCDPIEGVEPTMSNERWYVVSGRRYLVELKVVSRGPGARTIYISENEDLKLDYDQLDHWMNLPVPNSASVKFGWQNSRVLVATSQGLGKLSASLTYFTDHHESKEVLNVVQEVMVCHQVRIVKEETDTSLSSLMLPWSPDVYQEAELNAVGGCAKAPSDYRWLSSDKSVVSVSSLGVIQAKRPGKVVITVISTYDILNFDEVAVEVSIPSSMVMPPSFPVETVVGSHLLAAVTMKASNGGFYYKCDAFGSSIKWSTGSDCFQIVNTSREGSFKDELQRIKPSQYDYQSPCAWTYVYAASPGHVILRATFFRHADDAFSEQIMLKASSPIASYSPLAVHQAGDGNNFGGYWFNLENGLNDGLTSLNELYLAPGAFLDVTVVGGPNRWGKGVDFIERVDVFDERSVILKDDVLVSHVLTREEMGYRIECQHLGNFTLGFRRGNLIGDDHPQPAIAEAILQLECGFPSSVVVLADEPVNNLKAIQNAIQAGRLPGRIRSIPVTVSNGRTVRVSAVGISNSGKAFANSSTIQLQWELNNCEELASWDDAFKSQISNDWERYLALKNSSGQCIVRALVPRKFYDGHPSLSENVLTDAIPLQVVSTLQVFPEFSLVFFNPDAKMNLSVAGGSCFLDAVVNDSRVVEAIQPMPGLHCSKLTLVPRGVGTALVTVYDVGVSPRLAAVSEVKVADVDWLKIASGEVISLMEGSTNSVTVHAGTEDGYTFDSSQFTYMNIHVHVDGQHIDIVDDDSFSSDDGDVSAYSFTLYGKTAGVTTLYVTAKQQSGQEIYSQTIKVEVFTPPVVHPSEIFLVPGASFVLTVKGGPQIGVYIEYTSMNVSSVAVQETYGRLSAISPGTAKIVATFYGNGRAICQAHGVVRVGIPSAAVLNVQSEQLAVGREMPVFPLFVEGNLFSFYELCKDYKWHLENENVLSFNPSDRKEHNYQQPLDDDIDFIKVLYGRSGGKSNVVLTFSCDFLSPGGFSYSRSYIATRSIGVVPDPPLAQGLPITWILPPRYTTSDLLPSHMASHDQKHMQSQSGTVSYSLLGCCGLKNEDLKKGVSISGNKLKTSDSDNIACIQAKDHATGRIEVATCVRVAEVDQIRFLRKSPKHVLNLPIGAEVELLVHYYDSLGYPFLEAHDVVNYKVEINYPDILTLDSVRQKNGSIFVKAVRHGRALVGVRFDGYSRKSDYIMISVGAHVHPQNPVLHPGTYMNFSIEGVSDQVSGQWLSSNESIVSVENLSGRVLAVGEGTASVTFQSSRLKLQTTVTVLSGNVIHVDAPRDTLTNVPSPAGGYRFLVEFSTHKLGAHSKNVDVPYDCNLEPTYVGYVKPWKDLNTGDSYCLFFPYSPEHLESSVPKSMDRRPGISISVYAKLRDESELSGFATAMFVAGFSVLDKDSLQLNLTPDSNRSTITLVGNTDVGIYWLNRDMMMVRKLVEQGSGISGRTQFEVKVLKCRSFKDKLIFSLPSNGQKVVLDVNYAAKEGTSSSFNVLSWSQAIKYFALLIMTLVFLAYFCERGRPHPSDSPSTPNVAPQTPNHSSSSPSNEQSPRTPQPFIDYVRRTIDETPYYRREGRRRFDHQNTY